MLYEKIYKTIYCVSRKSLKFQVYTFIYAYKILQRKYINVLYFLYGGLYFLYGESGIRKKNIAC
jgi:hypothetical protein